MYVRLPGNSENYLWSDPRLDLARLGMILICVFMLALLCWLMLPLGEWALFAIISCVPAGIVGIYIYSYLCRMIVLSRKSKQCEDEFLFAFAGIDRQVAVSVRNAIALLYRVDMDTISAVDRSCDINKLRHDGGPLIGEFISAFLEVYGIHSEGEIAIKLIAVLKQHDTDSVAQLIEIVSDVVASNNSNDDKSDRY